MTDPKGEPIDYGKMRIVSIPLFGSTKERKEAKGVAVEHLREWAYKEYPKGTWYEIRLGVEHLLPRPEVGVWCEIALLIPLPEAAFTDLKSIADTGWCAAGGYYFIERREV